MKISKKLECISRQANEIPKGLQNEWQKLDKKELLFMLSACYRQNKYLLLVMDVMEEDILEARDKIGDDWVPRLFSEIKGLYPSNKKADSKQEADSGKIIEFSLFDDAG